MATTINIIQIQQTTVWFLSCAIENIVAVDLSFRCLYKFLPASMMVDNNIYMYVCI